MHHHHRHGGGGDFFITSSHIKDYGNPSDDDQDEFSVLLFIFSPLRTKGPKSVCDDFSSFATILYAGWSTMMTSGLIYRAIRIAITYILVFV